MKVTVIGTGYVGLVTGTCFAETGADVTCIDIDEKKIKALNKGIVPIFEPGLDTLISKNVAKHKLSFSTNLKPALKGCQVVFIAVGTPPGEDGSADLSHVLTVADLIGEGIEDYMVVVTKSTVPVGTSDKVRDAINAGLARRNLKIDFDVASNPEFLKEGDAINDFLKPDRIILGVDSARAEEMLRRLYKPFLLNQHPVLTMDIKSAELTKYAANSMLATRISFMNDIANLCDILGADVNMVRRGIGSDNRIGSKFLYPGIGYGGACFPKDVKALIKTGLENGYPLEILQSVDNVNNRQKTVILDKIRSHFPGLKGLKFALWGLSFKPQTDDMREAPSLSIISGLISEGARVTAYDPVAMNEAKRILGGTIDYATGPYNALEGADALILATEWAEFRLPDTQRMKDLMKGFTIFDGRNIYDPAEFREAGFTIYGIGRP